MAALVKQKKIHGGHCVHAKNVVGEIEALIRDITKENRYELAQLKYCLARSIKLSRLSMTQY